MRAEVASLVLVHVGVLVGPGWGAAEAWVEWVVDAVGPFDARCIDRDGGQRLKYTVDHYPATLASIVRSNVGCRE